MAINKGSARKKNAAALLLIFALLLVLVLTPLTGCSKKPTPLTAERKEATDYTRNTNASVYSLLDFDDTREIEFAEKGLIVAPESLEIKNEQGEVIWSQDAFAFVEDTEAPASANPSLWRHTQMNHNYGLFEVTDGIYQVRGYDLSNITFIAGETGWIVFDPLSNIETSHAALQLINDTLGERPVTGVVISHSHVDHFGGIKGVISEDDVRERGVPIIVPVKFTEHAVSENVYAGTAMGRRAQFMYGVPLAAGIKERLAVGLGVGMPSGTRSFITPTHEITYTHETLVVDGVVMEFQLTPGTEAPTEMNTWFPQKKAFWAAVNCTGTLHNLYTLRGAQVRDGNAWALYIMESITLFGDEVEVVFQSHNWPHWGNEEILEYMTNTAAAYKFINDQTLMYLNLGYTSDEISNMIKLPENLEKVWYTRQYYGTVAHDSKAVYQRFIGWYDANPAHLNPVTPTERAKKTVEYMGGADKVLQKAREDYEKGDYQWVAEITSTLVFADPTNKEARYLCADALEQLGYQAEAGTWRAAYLTGAQELRSGIAISTGSASSSMDILLAMEPYMVLDYMGILLDSNAAQGLNLKFNLIVPNDNTYAVTVWSGVMLYQKGTLVDDAVATITMPKQAVGLLLSPDVMDSEFVKFEGDKAAFQELYKYLVEFDIYFNIIEP